MAEERQLGELGIFSDLQECETEGCEKQTRERVWIGDRWRYTCAEHQSAVKNELRPKKVLGDE